MVREQHKDVNRIPKEELANFFYKETDGKYFRLCRPCCLCHNHSTHYRRYLSKWAWLCANKILSTKQLVSWIWPAGYCLSTTALKNALRLRERTQERTELEGETLPMRLKPTWARYGCSLLHGREFAGFHRSKISTVAKQAVNNPLKHRHRAGQGPTRNVWHPYQEVYCKLVMGLRLGLGVHKGTKHSGTTGFYHLLSHPLHPQCTPLMESKAGSK